MVRYSDGKESDIMKIAMLTNNYKPYTGGVPVSIDRLSAGLRRLGHEVFIFAPEYEGQCSRYNDEAENVIRYRSFKRRMDGGFVLPKSGDPIIEREMRRINPDIIHTHHPMLIGRRALKLGAILSLPVVYTYHTRYEQYLHYIKPLGKIEAAAQKSGVLGRTMAKTDEVLKERLLPSYMRGFINRCDMVFTPSGLISNVVDGLNVNTPHTVLATGVEDRFFAADRKKSEKIRSAVGKGKSVVFCTVSRLSKEKNIEFILRALAVYKNRFGSDFTYVLIGDGPLRPLLEQQATEMGLADNISFAGSVDNSEVHNYYAACDVFLFASKSETQGIVLLEAMASSMPVVAVKAGGVDDVVINGINGFKTEENIYDFAAMAYMTAANNFYNGKYGQGALHTAEEYSIDRMAQQAQKNYYRAIMSRREKENVHAAGI